MKQASNLRFSFNTWSKVFLLAALFVILRPILAQASGVQFTFNDYGLQTLTYNGQSYLSASPDANYSDAFATFYTPAGTPKNYGWTYATTLKNSIRSTGPDYSQQVYLADPASNPSLADIFTVKMKFSAPDTRTFKVDVFVTNNDPTDTLAGITFEYFLQLATPGPVTAEVPYVGSNLVVGSGGGDGQGAGAVSFLAGNWGSLAIYTDDYSKKWGLNSAAIGDFGTGKYFLLALSNYAGRAGSEPIPPGQTGHYTFYIRFGSPTDTAATLAPEAYAGWRATYPYLVNWPDRRPIATWFLGNGTPSETNPRSYLWDNTLDVYPLTPEKQSAFNTRLLNWTDSVIANMDSMNPKPQGILIWDLEGDEFFQYFTYVGAPNKIHDLAPEMDDAAAPNAVVDKMFKKLTDANYKIGMTLRPSGFMTGPTLPSTCYYENDDTLHNVNDVFINTSALSPYRGFVCTATNVWSQLGARQPYYQTGYDDDETIFNSLKSKVTYAHNRWGATMYYIDSTVYRSNGNAINFIVFRRLQEAFPDCIFFPENHTGNYFGASAPYNEGRGGSFNTPQGVKDIYPQAFSLLEESAGLDLTDPTIHDLLVQSVRDGNILLVQGWWPNPDNARTLQIYRDAASLPSTGSTVPTSGGSSTATTSGGSSTSQGSRGPHPHSGPKSPPVRHGIHGVLK